jgi:PAS domain S-box-containing protein
MKILLIEDNPADARLIQEMLKPAPEGLFELAIVAGLRLGLAALRERSWDVLLLDLGLPDSQGLETLAKALETRADWLPVIVLTGLDDEVLGVEAVRQGAQDFLVKTGLTAELLTRTLRYTVERHRAQRALLETEERFREMAENIECVFWMRSAGQSRMLYVSPAYERVWGRSVASLYQQPVSFIDAVHPADRERVRASVLQEHLPRPEEFEIEYRIVRPDGSIRWIRDHGFPIRSASVESSRIAGIAEDITSRKALEEAQRRLATAIEQAAEAFVITDAQGTIVYANAAFEKITGYSPQEALGQNPRILKSGKQDLAFYRRMWGSLVQGQVWRGRFVNKRKDGRLYEEDASITPLRDLTGQVTNYVAVKRDVSHEVLLEGALRQAQKMDAIGQLAGGVAHDFNNLLGIISGNAELLRMRGAELGTDAVEGLTHVIKAAERGASLTRQLLIFSRKQIMQPQPVALNELIGNLTKMLKRTIREDIRLECLYAEHLPFVQADPGMLEQVVLNLVVNARDAMPRGGRLVIATERVSRSGELAKTDPAARAGEFVGLAVSDTGVGIAPEHLQRIFEPFFTTKGPGKGTGLGLATVYGIVKQHQGWVEVASRLGQGATFKVFLPAIRPPPALTRTAPLAETLLRGGPETILLVEDDPPLRLVTRRVLEKFQYKVHEAACAAEALEVWRRHEKEIALVLTDFVMPGGMTGRDLAERLRAQRPGLKLIFMSGYSPETLDKETGFIERSRSYFLSKPCSPRTLLQTVRRCLDGNQAAEPLPSLR